jgi:hypothetical protein
MVKVELKPCPFCGGGAKIKPGRVYYDDCVRVHCPECGCATKPVLIGRPQLTVNGVDESTRYTEEQAANKVAEIWNRRV